MAYVWQRWMADEYRKAGLKVVEIEGWKNRGRPASTGNFDPRGQKTNHHTGTRTSASNRMPTLRTLIQGRPDLPGPLAQKGIGYDGTVYVIAAGRANHAGRVGKRGVPGMPYGADGNALALGDEVDTNGTQTMPKAQRDALAKVNAVDLKHFNRGIDYLHRHQDISGTGKWDIGSISTAALRRDAAAKINDLSGPSWKWNSDVVSDLPIVQEQFQIAAGVAKGTIQRYHGVAAIQNALNVKASEHLSVDGLCGPATVAAWKRWEIKHPGTGRATTPDMDSLRALQIAYRFKEPAAAPKPPPKPAPKPKVTTSVMTWNVENKGAADAKADRAEIIELVTAEKPSYVALQEVYRVDLDDIPGYQTYRAWEGYSVNSENRAQAILVRDDVAVKVRKALQMKEEWTGPKMGVQKEPRVHRYVTGNEHDTNIPVATIHVPFDKVPVEETRRAVIAWLEEMEAAHGIAIAVGDWNSLADELQAKVGTPAGAKVDGGGLDRAVFIGVKKIKGENLGKRGRSDHPVKIWTFEA